MDTTTLTLLVNAVCTPLLVVFTLWVRSNISTKERTEKREDKFIKGLEDRVNALEKEIREVRIELKNRDEDYLKLYKEHTTLKARYEVLVADHELLKTQYAHTVKELARLGTTTEDPALP